MSRLHESSASHGALLLLFFLCLAGQPQRSTAQTPRSVSIAAGTHALTAPWYTAPLHRGFNPAVTVGTDGVLRPGGWSLLWGVNLGFFRHRWWLTGISLEPELGIGRRLPGGFEAELRLGLGYMHYFWRRETLESRGGVYVRAGEGGRPSLTVPLSATLAYRGRTEAPLTVSPFVSARWGVQGLFLEEVPVMTHLFLLGGLRIERGATRSGRGR